VQSTFSIFGGSTSFFVKFKFDVMLHLGLNIFGGSTSFVLCNRHLVFLVAPPAFL
jgi:hypothetical protein